MGDPRHSHKKYSGPSHPWQKERIVAEGELVKEYGVKNKRELWKMQAILRNFADQAKKLIAAHGAQADKERRQLLEHLARYGLVPASATLDNVLSLTIRDVMEHRLQTQVYKKGFARTMRQARQFITHGHVLVGETKMTSPSYLVPIAQESTIAIVANSTLADPEHPERQIVSKSDVKRGKTEAKEEAEPEAPEAETQPVAG